MPMLGDICNHILVLENRQDSHYDLAPESRRRSFPLKACILEFMMTIALRDYNVVLLASDAY